MNNNYSLKDFMEDSQTSEEFFQAENEEREMIREEQERLGIKNNFGPILLLFDRQKELY